MKGRQRYFLVGDTEKESYLQNLAAQVQIVDRPEQADAILVFGGDGTLLHAIGAYSDLQIPFVGIHAGTRGFLMNNTDDPAEFCKRLEHLEFVELWMLQAVVETPQETIEIRGFNDVWVERLTGQTLRMRVSIDGIRQPPLIVGDGLIFSTPQGSTGYNAAARGKVISPGVPVLQITPLSCVVDKTPIESVILAATSEIVVDFEQIDKRPGIVYHDGIQLEPHPVQRLTVRRGEQRVSLGFAPEYTFTHKVLSWQFPSV